MNRLSLLHPALYVLLCLIWGTTWMAIKVGLRDAPPFWSAALRFIIAVTILMVINAIRRSEYPRGWRNKLRVAWPGLFTYFGSYTLTYVGSVYITSALASILFAVMPFFVMLLMVFMIKDERVSWRSLLGVGIGFAGVVLIFAEPVSYSENALVGMVLLLLSPLAAAVGTVSIRAYLKDEPVLPMVTIQMALGAILLTATAFIVEDFALFHFTADSVGALLFLAIFGSVIAFSVYYWLLQRIKLMTMSLIALITPAVAMVAGYIFLNEILTPTDYFGAVLILGGVAVVNLQGKK
ncbi:MAG: DMT family transporter [candidate division Zixibacteria bacterium]|nr:DMT family transporter [candidate division Zixibacteria bacterium]